MQLEMQINTLESANLNAETMQAMKKASDVLSSIHGYMTMDKVDATLSKIAEQREIATEIADAISGPIGAEVADEDELKAELEQLEQEHLDERLAGAEHVPVHVPAGARRVEERPRPAIEDDEDAQLRELQAALAM